MRLSGLFLISLVLLAPLYWYGPMVFGDLAAVLVGYPAAFAFTAMAFSMALSLRLGWQQWLFGGLREGNLAQRWLVVGAVVGIGFHHAVALLFGGKSLIAPLVLLTGNELFYGILAGIAVLSIVQIPQRAWRWLFGLIGGFFVAIVSMAGLALLSIVSGDPLAIYLTVVSGLGLLCFLLSFLPFRVLEGRHAYRIASLEPAGMGLAVSLEAEDGGIRHRAGQYALFRFVDEPAGPVRSLPISKQPDSDHCLRVSLPDDDDLEEALVLGGEVRVSCAFGRFSRDGRTPEVWIAAGPDVAPFVAFAHMFKDDSLPVDFFYCVANEDEAPYLQDFRNVADRYPAFHLHLVETDMEGDLTVDQIEASVAAAMSEVMVYYCGPSDLRRRLRAGLLSNGLEARQFRSARYDLRTGLDVLALPGLAWRGFTGWIGRLFRREPS